jgi:hypothetical protein
MRSILKTFRHYFKLLEKHTQYFNQKKNSLNIEFHVIHFDSTIDNCYKYKSNIK